MSTTRASLRPLALSLLLSATTLAFGYLCLHVFLNRNPGETLGFWSQWDTVHYLQIAKSGYEAAGDHVQLIVFFPLYPWLIRLVDLAVSNPLLSALLVSNAFCAAAAVLLFRLSRLERDEETALRCVFYCLVFPTAYFFHVGYTESLYLALVLGSFLQARRGRWPLAAMLGGLASLTRLTGIALLPALLVELFLQRRDLDPKRLRAALAWLILVPSGLLIYFGINLALHGDPFAFLGFQATHWSKRPGAFWQGFLYAWNQGFRGSAHDAVMLGGMEWSMGALALLLNLWALFRFRASYAIFGMTSWLMITTSSFWQSTPRYVLTPFPIFLVMADWGRRPVIHAALSFASILLYAAFLCRFVQGAWAF